MECESLSVHKFQNVRTWALSWMAYLVNAKIHGQHHHFFNKIWMSVSQKKQKIFCIQLSIKTPTGSNEQLLTLHISNKRIDPSEKN